DRYFSSRSHGITGFLARQNLAAVYEEMRDLPSAEKEWRQVVEEMPRYRPGLQGLGETLIKQGKHTDAEKMAARLEKDGALRPAGLMLLGKLALTAGRVADARQAFARASQEFPQDAEAREAF